MEKDTKNCRPHVLVLPYPAQGHINPMLQFSKRLVSKGLKTTLATTVYIAKSMSVSSPSPNGLNIDVKTISDGFDDKGFIAAGSIQEYLTSLRLVGAQSLARLVSELGGLGDPVTAIVYDGFLPWAFGVGKKLGLETVLFFTQTCAVNNVYYHVNRGILGLPFEEEMMIKVPGLPLLKHMEVPSYLKEPDSYPAYYDLVVNAQFSNIDEVDWVLYNTFYELEEEVLDWVAKLWRIRTIGPTVPSMYLDKQLDSDRDYGINMYKPMTDSCRKWLDTKPRGSVLYISFGSMAGLDTEQTTELAIALKELEYSSLWVVREAEQAKVPERFLEEAGEKILVVTWSPQLEVLSHESVGCFLTHCGLNSTLEALSLGVPVVAMPQWSDQRTNAKYVEDVWGTGIRVGLDGEGIVRSHEVEQCVKEIMEGEKGKEAKRNAIRWRNMAREAISEGGSSDKNIDEFIASLQIISGSS